MALFRGHMLRISAFVVVIILGAYKLVNRMQYSMHTFNMTQTSIAIIGLATVMLLTVTHNRRQGGFLTPTQEELLLASSFALFWFSAFIAYRVFGQRGLAAGHGVESIHHDWHERTIHPVASSVLHPNDYGYNRGWDKDHRPGQRPPQRAGMPTERPGNYEGFNWPCPSDAARCIVEECAPGKRRIETDVMKMLMSDHEVTLVNDSVQEFYVRFHGPEETPFAGGVWKIHVELPDQYPFKSPSIGFMNKIFHPNIDELSGSVCLDVINQTWSPMFDLINIFEVFLPQLLRYPNPNDPLNGDAASLLMRHPKEYDAKVKDYVQRYATKEAADAADGKTTAEEEEEDEEMSDIGSFSDHDE